jgi:hypothetical protein
MQTWLKSLRCIGPSKGRDRMQKFDAGRTGRKVWLKASNNTTGIYCAVIEPPDVKISVAAIERTVM